MSEFKVGDIVVLLSGSADMTVIGHHLNDPTLYSVSWYAKGRVRFIDGLPEAALKKSDPDARARVGQQIINHAEVLCRLTGAMG